MADHVLERQARLGHVLAEHVHDVERMWRSGSTPSRSSSAITATDSSAQAGPRANPPLEGEAELREHSDLGFACSPVIAILQTILSKPGAPSAALGDAEEMPLAEAGVRGLQALVALADLDFDALALGRRPVYPSIVIAE